MIQIFFDKSAGFISLVFSTNTGFFDFNVIAQKKRSKWQKIKHFYTFTSSFPPPLRQIR